MTQSRAPSEYPPFNSEFTADSYESSQVVIQDKQKGVLHDAIHGRN